MNLSVIIPARNAEHTLPKCLAGIFQGREAPREVIVVDDVSSDNTIPAASAFPCHVIALTHHHGSAHARNVGVDCATGSLLVFIDADVIIAPDTLSLIKENFQNNPSLAAVTGLLAADTPFRDFFTDFKNLYMHFVFSRSVGRVSFLYGSLMAIRRAEFLRFDETIRMEDTEMGQRLYNRGKVVFLDPRLQVTHLKRYNLLSLAKNDFLVPFWWAKNFLIYGGFQALRRDKTFAHAKRGQLASILAVFGTVVSIAIVPDTPWVVAGFFSAFLGLQAPFFYFLGRRRGLIFTIKSAVWVFIDCCFMGLGILIGLAYFRFRKRA